MKKFGLLILSYLSFVICAFATHAEYKEFGDIRPPEKMYTAETIDDAFLWKIEDSTGTNTAASVGTRTGDVGPNSMTIGENNEASGKDSIAAGQNATASDDTSFVWNGDSQTNYTSKGEGTFNVNTTNGLKDVFIGDTNLYDHITSMVLPIHNEFIMYYNTSFEEWPHEIDTEVYHEQSYEFDEESGYSGDALLIKLPTNSSLTYTKMNVYIHQFPQNSFYYDIASDNIVAYPSRKFWMEESENDSIWKFEFESFPGCKDWTLMRFVQREIIPPIEMTKFYFNDGSVVETNIVGIMDNRYAGNSSLTNVILSRSITNIEESAFASCIRMASITIPKSVIEIGDKAFYRCIGMNAFIVDDNNQIYKSLDGLLLSKDGQTLISGVNGEVVIPNSVTNIEWYAFYGYKNLTSITMSDNLLNIGDYAFSMCTNLPSVIIPNSVTSIGTNAFFNSGIRNVTVPGTITKFGKKVFSSCNKLQTAIIENGITSISSYMFEGCPVLSNVSLPDSLQNIEDYAFSSCPGIENIEIPNTVTNIGDSAFYGCNGLTTITIPDNVLQIGASAFSNCSKLESVTLGVGITNIKIYAFFNNSKLNTFNYYRRDDETNEQAYNRITGLISGSGYDITGKDFICLNPIVPQEDSLFYIKTGSEIEIVTNSITTVAKDAYKDNTSLVKVELGSIVTNIAQSAFSGCSKLESITMQEGMLNIANYAFSSCTNLTEVVIPSSTTSVGYRAFSTCRGLKTVTFNGDIQTFGNQIFYNCSAIELVEFKEKYMDDVINASGYPWNIRSEATIRCKDGDIPR